MLASFAPVFLCLGTGGQREVMRIETGKRKRQRGGEKEVNNRRENLPLEEGGLLKR